MKVICLDFDDVICDGNIIYKMAKEFHDKFSEMVDFVELIQSNRDPKKFYSVIKKAVKLGEGVDFGKIQEAGLSFEPIPGAYETLKEIRLIGYKTVIVSTDDRTIIENFLNKYKMMKFVDHIYASELGVKDGILDGTIKGDSIETEKTGALKIIKKMYNVKDNDIFYVGDGLTDLPILRIVNSGALFCPNILTKAEVFMDKKLKKKIENESLFLIENKDLREIIDFMP